MNNEKLWHRDFTIMVVGQVISMFGNSLLRFALSVYILRLTGSGTLFGTTLALSTIPVVLLSPFGGIMADRVSRKRIMVALDFFTAALTGVSLLFLTGSGAVAAVIVVLVLLNIIQAFYGPSVQSSVPVLLHGDNIVRGNAVVSQVGALSNLLGPALGGILSAAIGILPVVGICAGCFFVSAVMELFLHIPFTRRPAEGVAAVVREDLKTSVRFMRHEQPGVMRIMATVAVFNFVFTPLLTVGISILVINILGLSDTLYGIGYAAIFLGSLIGAVASGVLAGKFSTEKLYLALAACALCLVPIALVFFLALPDLAAYGVTVLCFMVAMALASLFSVFALSTVQQRTPKNLLGQIYGYIMALGQCATPLGQFVYGVLFDVFTRDVYILLAGAAVLSLVVAFNSRRAFAGFAGQTQERGSATGENAVGKG